MIFRKNNLNIGIGLGLLLPLAVFGALYGITHLALIPLKVRTLALLSICANIFLTTQFRKNRANESVRGLVVATVGLSILWIFWFGQEIFEEL